MPSSSQNKSSLDTCGYRLLYSQGVDGFSPIWYIVLSTKALQHPNHLDYKYFFGLSATVEFRLDELQVWLSKFKTLETFIFYLQLL